MGKSEGAGAQHWRVEIEMHSCNVVVVVERGRGMKYEITNSRLDDVNRVDRSNRQTSSQSPAISVTTKGNEPFTFGWL